MNDTIFNKIGLFKYDGNEFYGMITKNNGNLEFTVINYLFKSGDDYLLIPGFVGSEKVSLVIFNRSMYYSSAYTREESFLIRALFVGKCFKNFEDIKFRNISIKINNISSVMMKFSSFVHNFTEENKEKYSPLIIKPKEDISVDFNEFKFKIQLNHFYEKWKRVGNGEYANFKEDISILLEYNEFQKVGRITKDSLIIENLFSFITGKSKIIEMKCLDDKDEYIDLILPIVSEESVESRQYPSAIQLDESNADFIIKKWFENSNRFDSFYDLYFSLEKSSLNPTTLFLTYCRMLESYHKQRYSEQRVFFQNRLTELFSDLIAYDFFKEILEKYGCEEEDIVKFSSIIKDNRNYYTHYGRIKDNVVDGKELLELNEVLKLIIDLIFLKEFEFSVDEINDITSKSKNFRFTTYVSLEL